MSGRAPIDWRKILIVAGITTGLTFAWQPLTSSLREKIGSTDAFIQKERETYGYVGPHYQEPPTAITPFLIDYNKDGVLLTTRQRYFDVDNDDFWEAILWAAPNTGFIFKDSNNDGRVSHAGEIISTGQLGILDSNYDMEWNALDETWHTYRIWIDKNGDADSREVRTRGAEIEEREIFTLDEANIKSIKLNNGSTAFVDMFPVIFTDGSTTTAIFQNLEFNQTQSRYIGNYKYDFHTGGLPDLRGFGNLPQLSIAMSLDSELLNTVRDFVELEPNPFLDCQVTKTKIENIFYRWAKADQIAPDSRGPHIDGRKLRFLEKMWGNDFVQFKTWRNPKPVATKKLMMSWDALFKNMGAHLISQKDNTQFFEKPVVYNHWIGDFERPISPMLPEMVILQAKSIREAHRENPEKAKECLLFFKNYLEAIKGTEAYSAREQALLNNLAPPDPSETPPVSP